MESRPWPKNPRYIVREDGVITGPSGRELVGIPDRDGYAYHWTYAGSRTRRAREYVHVIVCETFHGPRPEGKYAAHENGTPADCRASNLRWATWHENRDDCRRHGRLNEGARNGRARLTDEQVRAIRAALSDGVLQRVLATEHGISQAVISAIATGKTWTSVT